MAVVIKGLEEDIARRKALLKGARLLAKSVYALPKVAKVRRRRHRIKPVAPVSEVPVKRRRGRPQKPKPAPEVPVTSQ